MKTTSIYVSLFVFGSVAHGGTVVFDPSVVELDRSASELGAFDLVVSMNPDFEGFDSADILLNTGDLPIMSFHPAAGWSVSPCDFLCLPSILLVGMIRSAPIFVDQISVGTLTVDLAALEDGTYVAHVDNRIDGGYSAVGLRGVPEPLYGRATVTIVPEPGMVLIIGVSGVFLGFWRRQSSRMLQQGRC
ncbi:MAG: hypothetical protein AABZ47_06565 [Planctomycetota bacterium]